MDLANNIKKLREKRGLLQKEVAAEIELKPAHYNKIETGAVEPSIRILQRLAVFFGVTIDQIVNLRGELPKEVVSIDKTIAEKVRMIERLGKKDRDTLYNMLDTMVTKQKFQHFFKENLPEAK